MYLFGNTACKEVARAIFLYCHCLSRSELNFVQAYAAARMAESVLLGLDGSDDIYECAYVDSSVTKLPFFASKVCTGPLPCCTAPACACQHPTQLGGHWQELLFTGVFLVSGCLLCLLLTPVCQTH